MSFTLRELHNSESNVKTKMVGTGRQTYDPLVGEEKWEAAVLGSYIESIYTLH